MKNASDPYHKLWLAFCMTSKNVFLIEFIYFRNIVEKPFFENIEHILHVICHVIRSFKIQSMAVSIQSS